MRGREFAGYKLPDNLVRTTNQEVDIAGTNLDNLAVLKEKALVSEQIALDTWALLLPKRKTYTTGAGLDNMLFVAREHERLTDVAQMTAPQLQRLLTMAVELQQVYEQQEDAKDPVVLQAMAINYHANPVAKDVFDKKLSAQTLKDLHVHVVGFRATDLRGERKLERDNVARQEWRDIHDPFLKVTEKLWEQPTVRAMLIKELVVLQPAVRNDLPGVNLVIAEGELNSEALARDLITLHTNFVQVYKMIAGLFVDLTKQDGTGMPELRTWHERTTAWQEFVADLEAKSGQTENTARLAKWLERVNKILVSGEAVRVEQKAAQEKVVFMRDPAYTLSMLRQAGKQNVTVNLAPRILSTGNFLAALGLHRVVGGEVTAAWLAERECNERAIVSHFAHEQNELAAK